MIGRLLGGRTKKPSSEAANERASQRAEAGQSPLHAAADDGDLQALRRLLGPGADTTAADNEGMTPLLLAAKSGHAEACRLLLTASADVAATDKNGWTPLHWAGRGEHAKAQACRALLDARAEVNSKACGNGFTPLNFAYNGEVRSLLVERGGLTAHQLSSRGAAELLARHAA